MKQRVVLRNAFFCITAALGDINAAPELFSRHWNGKISPLFWRVPILLWALAVTGVSVASFWGERKEMFLLYMTHWGLIFIIVESIFGIVVAVKQPKSPPDATFGLPWYVKTYWVLYNITVPVAFLITVFYWCILNSAVKNHVPNGVVDVMLHGVNSLVMLVELICSAHPSRLLHIMQPLYFAGVYLLFTLIYFFAGGVDPWGNPFVYPVLDWSKPDQTMIVVTLTALFLALMHLLTVAIAAVRDLIAKKCIANSNHVTGVYNEAFDA